MPERVAFIFGWDAARAAAMVAGEPEAVRLAIVIAAFAREIAAVGPLDRELFRAAAKRAGQQTGAELR